MAGLAEALEAKPDQNSLAYWLWKPVQRYLDRGNKLASEGWEQASTGSEQVRGGNLPSGLANMLLGPVNAVSAPITALLPTEEEIQSGPYPEGVKQILSPAVAAAGMFLPGPKGAKGSRALEGAADVYHGSPTLRNLTDFDLNAPRRTDYGYLGDGLYVAPKEWIARGYAGHKGYIHPLKMPEGKYKDFPYVDQTYQKSVNEFARSIGVKAEEGTREWAREFSEKMRALGYAGARGMNDDGSMAEAVIFDPKSAITKP